MHIYATICIAVCINLIFLCMLSTDVLLLQELCSHKKFPHRGLQNQFVIGLTWVYAFGLSACGWILVSDGSKNSASELITSTFMFEKLNHCSNFLSAS